MFDKLFEAQQKAGELTLYASDPCRNNARAIEMRRLLLPSAAFLRAARRQVRLDKVRYVAGSSRLRLLAIC